MIIVHGIAVWEACPTRASVIFVDRFRLDIIQDLQILSSNPNRKVYLPPSDDYLAAKLRNICESKVDGDSVNHMFITSQTSERNLKSTRTRRPTDRLCLYVDAEEHELGDLGEPANYKAALLDPGLDKCLMLMKTMNPTAQQIAIDNTLVAHENQVKIGICNMRIDPTKTPKEPTYQVVLDALALTTCYPAFLITTEVPEIYMHQFWHTITKIKNSSSYKFKLDKKKCIIDVEVLRDILQICPRLSNQESYEPTLENLCCSHQLMPFWENHRLYVPDRQQRLHERRETCFSVLPPAGMTNRKMLNSTAYKTYFAFATGETTPKKAWKFKKPASLLGLKVFLMLFELLLLMMRIEQYIQMIDYALWEIIENGATLSKTKIVEGVMTKMPITTAEEKTQRRLEVKARSTLMMGGMDIK
ncbi:hypothetical protein Tco_0599756 [Tanacetum coccineum]